MRAWMSLLFLAACGGSSTSSIDGGDPSDSAPGAIDSAPGTADAACGSGGCALPWLPGVNLAGAEFGSNIPGTPGTDYAYPTHAEIDYFMGKGLTTFRIPFLWERLQRSLNGALDTAELGRLQDIVGYATGKGAYVIIDPHNYARYGGNVVGSGGLPNAALADLWTRLATLYAGNDHVIFGLMNEPNSMPTEQWLSAANEAIAAIRTAGAPNLVLVPGNAWTGAHSWEETWYGSANAVVMLGVVDPMDRYAYEAHQYLDGDQSGTSPNCTSETAGAERLTVFTNWLVANHKRGFLGEFGGGRNATCYAALDNMLAHLDAHRDVWLGFTYWAAGPIWGNYDFTLEPSGNVDAPQLASITPHVHP